MEERKSLIFTGYACNESCFFCSAEVEGRKHINKKTKEILTEILSEYKLGSRSVEFIGGEVTIRPDINIILAFAKKLGFEKISIETNGTILADREKCEKLLQNGLNYLTISIHGSNASLNDAHTELKGSFDLKIKGLDNLTKLEKKYNIHVSTNYVVTSKNILDVEHFLLLMDNYEFLEKNIFAFVRPIKKYNQNYQDYLPDFQDIKTVFEGLKINKKLLIQYLPYCVLDEKFHESYLDFFAKGLKKNVNKLNIENQTSLESAIQSEEYYFTECKTCKYNTKCRGVWHEYVDFFKMEKAPLLIDIK